MYEDFGEWISRLEDERRELAARLRRLDMEMTRLETTSGGGGIPGEATELLNTVGRTRENLALLLEQLERIQAVLALRQDMMDMPELYGPGPFFEVPFGEV